MIMGKKTIRVQNNGVAWATQVERFQLKKYITDNNPTGDVIKIKFANMLFVIPSNIWFKKKLASKTFFDLHQMGILGQWKQELPQSKWDKMSEGNKYK